MTQIFSYLSTPITLFWWKTLILNSTVFYKVTYTVQEPDCALKKGASYFSSFIPLKSRLIPFKVSIRYHYILPRHFINQAFYQDLLPIFRLFYRVPVMKYYSFTRMRSLCNIEQQDINSPWRLKIEWSKGLRACSFIPLELFNSLLFANPNFATLALPRSSFPPFLILIPLLIVIP